MATIDDYTTFDGTPEQFNRLCDELIKLRIENLNLRRQIILADFDAWALTNNYTDAISALMTPAELLEELTSDAGADKYDIERVRDFVDRLASLA